MTVSLHGYLRRFARVAWSYSVFVALGIHLLLSCPGSNRAKEEAFFTEEKEGRRGKNVTGGLGGACCVVCLLCHLSTKNSCCVNRKAAASDFIVPTNTDSFFVMSVVTIFGLTRVKSLD